MMGAYLGLGIDLLMRKSHLLVTMGASEDESYFGPCGGSR